MMGQFQRPERDPIRRVAWRSYERAPTRRAIEGIPRSRVGLVQQLRVQCRVKIMANERVKSWDEWMPGVKLPMSMADFRRLPRNAAYQYEYLGGHALLSPRPKHFHAVLTLADFVAPPPGELESKFVIRPMDPSDMDELPPVFAAAFHGVQPFGSLTDEECRQAARESLLKTWQGRDGPVIAPACFMATHAEGGRPLGGILITQVIGGNPSEHASYTWPETPPLNVRGQPHLTWIFVAPIFKTVGVGSALLAAAIEVLLAQGHEELWSTFLLGNDSSLLWHWRNGFRLAPYEFSRRQPGLGGGTI